MAAEIQARAHVAFGLQDLGLLALSEGQPARATHLFAAAEPVLEVVGHPVLVTRPDPAALDRAVAEARRRLGAAAWASAWQRGRAMSLEEAVAYALTDEPDRAPSAPAPLGTSPPASAIEPLTARERDVAALIAQGLTSREIAEVLVSSERTVDVHADRIRTELGLRSRAEIAAWAVEHGLRSRE